MKCTEDIQGKIKKRLRGEKPYKIKNLKLVELELDKVGLHANTKKAEFISYNHDEPQNAVYSGGSGTFSECLEK